MKKIKLFLITLLSMVGVMNVAAQVITESPHPQDIKVVPGVGTRDGQRWTSAAGYDKSDNNLRVSDSEWSIGVGGLGDSNGNLTLDVAITNSTRSIDIQAPSGWVIVNYSFTPSCSRAYVTCEGTRYNNGEPVNVPINGLATASFSVVFNSLNIFEKGSATFNNFIVTLKRGNPAVIYDSEGVPVISGGRYALSTTRPVTRLLVTEYPDFYFYADDDNSEISTTENWTFADEQGFIDAKYVWVPEHVDGTNWLTLKNLKHGKYLAGEIDPDDPKFYASSQADAMKFWAKGPYDLSWVRRTPYYYALETVRTNEDWLDYKFLNFNQEEGESDMCLWPESNDRNSRFRFHQVEYVTIESVYIQDADGFCEPISYKVNNSAVKNGVTEWYHEHNANTGATIEGKIVVTPGTEIGEYETKYYVNGIAKDSPFGVDDLKSTDVIEVIFVRVNAEPVGKFVKVKKNDQYLTASATALSVAGNSNDAIFYHDGMRLLSYTRGIFMKDASVGEIEEAGSGILFLKNNATEPEVALRSGLKYLTINGSAISSVDDKPVGEYTIETVAKLPVVLNEVGGHRYGTFYAPVDVEIPEGLEAYRVDGIQEGEDTDVLNLVEVTGKIPAETGVLLYEVNASTKEYTVTITDNATKVNSMFDGVYPRRYVKEDETLYGLNKKTINGKETAGFYKMRTGSALSPFRAFLDYTEPEQGESKGFVFSFDEADLIEAIEMSHADDTMYDLQGRRVQNPGTGIYIVNGKKIMIRK